MPAFTLDSKNQPTACGDGSSPTWNPVFFDPDFHFPQTLKLALGADHLLPWGIVGTLDFLYTRSVFAAHTVDVNHRLVGTAAAEGGRAMYGTVDPETGELKKSRRFPALGEVYQMRNGGGDRSYSITAQLGKRFPHTVEDKNELGNEITTDEAYAK